MCVFRDESVKNENNNLSSFQDLVYSTVMLVTLSFIASIFVIWRSISLFLTAMLFFTVEAQPFL